MSSQKLSKSGLAFIYCFLLSILELKPMKTSQFARNYKVLLILFSLLFIYTSHIWIIIYLMARYLCKSELMKILLMNILQQQETCWQVSEIGPIPADNRHGWYSTKSTTSSSDLGCFDLCSSYQVLCYFYTNWFTVVLGKCICFFGKYVYKIIIFSFFKIPHFVDLVCFYRLNFQSTED